jgi:alpha-ketoglutarate-dependent taurine dioxygenase
LLSPVRRYGCVISPDTSHAALAEARLAVSQRGVVFFRAQDDLTNDLQKKLILRLGELTGRPATSGLHIHPILNSERELGGSDPEISTISSVQHNKFYVKNAADSLSPKKQSSAQWHSDIAFEPIPADYTSLRLIDLPETGGGECYPLLPSRYAA